MSLPKHLNKKKHKKALIKPRYLQAFPPHHLQVRKAILLDWMLHDVICWRLRPSLDSLDHLSFQNCAAQQAWEIGKVSTLKYLKSGMANLRDVTNVLPRCRQIIKSPSQATHTRLPGTSPRECFATVGTMSLNRTMGFLGRQEIHQPDSLSRWSCIPLFGHGLPQSLWEVQFFSTPEKAWKSVTASETAMHIYPTQISLMVLLWRPLEMKMLAALPTAVVHGANACTQGHLHQRCCILWELADGVGNKDSFKAELFPWRNAVCLFACLPSNMSKGKDMVAPLWKQPFHVPPCLQLYRPANKNSTSGIQTQTRCRISQKGQPTSQCLVFALVVLELVSAVPRC